MSIQVIYPVLTENSNQMLSFLHEAKALSAVGIKTACFDADSLQLIAPSKGRALFRYSSMNASGYQSLHSQCLSSSIEMEVPPASVVQLNNLPGVYETLSTFMPETVFIEKLEDFPDVSKSLDWARTYVLTYQNEFDVLKRSTVCNQVSMARLSKNAVDNKSGESVCLRNISNINIVSDSKVLVMGGQPVSHVGQELPKLVYQIIERLPHMPSFYTINLIQDNYGKDMLWSLSDAQSEPAFKLTSDDFAALVVTAYPHYL